MIVIEPHPLTVSGFKPCPASCVDERRGRKLACPAERTSLSRTQRPGIAFKQRQKQAVPRLLSAPIFRSQKRRIPAALLAAGCNQAEGRRARLHARHGDPSMSIVRRPLSEETVNGEIGAALSGAQHSDVCQTRNTTEATGYLSLFLFSQTEPTSRWVWRGSMCCICEGFQPHWPVVKKKPAVVPPRNAFNRWQGCPAKD